MSREDSPITTEVRHRAASLALAATIALTAFKLAVGYLSNSVSVFSEGIHSFLDLISAAVGFFSVREAGKPADAEHPFGHGKFETLSSLLEAVLLALAAVFICYESIGRIEHPQAIQYTGLAIAVTLVSIVVSYLMFRHNRSAAVTSESSAIHVNALHFLSDVIAGAGVVVGLVLLKLTGWALIDPIIAIGIAAYIFGISIKQVRAALLELTDTQLPDEEITLIRSIIDEFKGRMLEAHDLRTRKSGATRHIDFHLVLCGEFSVHQSHALCDEIEERIMKSFPTSSVTIHVEPCEHENVSCHESCQFALARKAKESTP